MTYLPIIFWTVIYSLVVAASIIFIGKPISGGLTLRSLFLLLIDLGFIFGAFLALAARFIFVVINNLASQHPQLKDAHLTIAALATMGSIIAIIIANAIFLNEQLRPIQIVGAIVILIGIFLIFK